MAITLAQTPAVNNSGGTTQLVLTPGAAFTATNGLVVVVGSVSRAPSSVQDSNGVSLTQIRTANFFGSPFSTIWYLSSVTGSPTSVKVNFASSTTCQATAYEVLGTITAHAGNAANANTTTAAAGAFTTTTADTIVFLGLQDGVSITAPSGYAIQGNAQSGASAYKVYTTTQSGINPTWSNTSGGTAATAEAFTSTNTTGPGVNVSLADTLTWTGTEKATGRDVKLADTITWTYTHTATGHDVKLADTLTWTDTQVATGHDAATADALTWSGTFTATGRDAKLADTLTWTDAPAATGRDVRTADTLTWTDTPAATGRDMPPLADTLTWTGSLWHAVDDVGQTNDTLTWTDSLTARPDPAVLLTARLTWADAFAAGLDLHDTLRWSDVFWSPDDVGPRHALLTDVLTWRQTFDVPIRTTDALGWSDAFVVQNPVVGWADTLYWRETTQADVNLLAIGRYRR